MWFKSRMRKPSLFGVAAAAVLAVAACSSATGQTGQPGQAGASGGGGSGSFKVEIVSSLTGTSSAEGVPEVSGMQSAIDLFNSQGGVGGHKISVSVLDDQSSVTSAVAEGRAAVAAHPVAILDGGLASELSARLPVYATAKLPVYGVLASFTGLLPYLYSVDETATQTATSIANLAKATLGGSLAGKKVAIIAVGDAEGQKTEEAVRAGVAAQGGTVSSAQLQTVGAPSFGSGAAQIIASGAQAVVSADVPASSTIEVKALKSAGFTGPIAVDYGAADAGTLAGIGISGLLAARIFSYAEPGSYMAQTAQRFGQTTGMSSVAFSLGWAQAFELIDGLKKCGYPCDAAGLIKATNSLGTISVPGNVAFGPLVVSPTVHNALTHFQVFRWDQATKTATAVGAPISVGPPGY